MIRVSEAIKRDHRELEDCYNNILDAVTDDDKTRWQNQFTWELARHSVGEELIVYPAMEKHLPDGKEMADKDRKEHQKVKEQLYIFQNLKASDPKFKPTIKALWTDLSEHIKEEEEHDLKLLEKALEEADSEELLQSFNRAKMFAPTRSHPSAPDKPPFENVAGLLAAPIDHLRDLFNKFPNQDTLSINRTQLAILRIVSHNDYNCNIFGLGCPTNFKIIKELSGSDAPPMVAAYLADPHDVLKNKEKVNFNNVIRVFVRCEQSEGLLLPNFNTETLDAIKADFADAREKYDRKK
ncbi:hypothetical protein BGZ52_011803 [Haplosporangium bisporale]|nr:hypothetical protein BGZ52_011803 [Haplosporangium bisporale]